MKTVSDKNIIAFMRVVANATDFGADEYELAFEMVYSMLKDRKLKNISDTLERMTR